MRKTQSFIFCLLVIAGCRDPLHLGKMADKGRTKPYGPVEFFADGQSARPLVYGTVSRDQTYLIENPGLATGVDGGKLMVAFPMPVTKRLLQRGRERFEIYCAPCHESTGDGNGMIVRRGSVPPPSFHLDRLRNAPVGHFVNVIANGWGTMFSYNDRVAPEDRWAIAAYIKVLQLSRHAPVAMIESKQNRANQ